MTKMQANNKIKEEVVGGGGEQKFDYLIQIVSMIISMKYMKCVFYVNKNIFTKSHLKYLETHIKVMLKQLNLYIDLKNCLEMLQ